MNALLLKNDEFLVESDVRLLTGNHVQRVEKLLERLEGENKYPVLAPLRAHNAALKNPKREIDICSSKLLKLKTQFVDHAKDLNTNDLNTIVSRALHVNARLNRISSSPAYRELALERLNIGLHFLEVVQSFQLDSSLLDESVENASKLDIEATEETIDPYEGLDSSTEKSVEKDTTSDKFTSSPPKSILTAEKLTALASSPHTSELVGRSCIKCG